MSNIRDEILERAAKGDIEGVDASQFALDTPKAQIHPPDTASTGSKGVRPSEPPKQRIEEFRQIADTGSHVGEGIDTLVDFLVGSGFSVQPTNVPGTDQEQTDEDIADLKALVESSTFETVLIEWVWHALVDGTAFLEIVVEDDTFKPKVLPTERISIVPDEQGDIVAYEMERPSGGGGGNGNEPIEFAPSDLAVLRFHKHPGEDFGHSVIERAQEQADMLRDMEIDLARFIATKAFPPILWKLGSEERPKNQDDIDDWLEELEEIEPESQLATGHDVEHEIVGATSTSSESGAMKLDGVFKHLQNRIAAALGVPAFLLNMDVDTGRNESVAIMPKFDRRINRYRRVIREVIRHQIFVSILVGDGDVETYNEIPPDFQFGKHSSEEERLDIDTAISLVNAGLLTFEAAAKRVGIDPETELPTEGEIDEHVERINALAGRGDDMQNPDGGRPTDNGTGTRKPGDEVDGRQEPEKDQSDGRSKKGATE